MYFENTISKANSGLTYNIHDHIKFRRDPINMLPIYDFMLPTCDLEAAYVWLKITITIGEEHYLL